MRPLDRIYALHISGLDKYQIVIWPAVEQDVPGSLWLASISKDRNSGGNNRYFVAFDEILKSFNVPVDIHSPRAAKVSCYVSLGVQSCWDGVEDVWRSGSTHPNWGWPLYWRGIMHASGMMRISFFSRIVIYIIELNHHGVYAGLFKRRVMSWHTSS